MFKSKLWITLAPLALAPALLSCATHSELPSNPQPHGISPISKSTLIDNIPITIDSSPTGVIWQKMPKVPDGLVAQGNGIFIALMRPKTSPKVIADVGDQPYISANGRDWTPLPARIPVWGRDVLFADGWFYVAGESIPPNTTLGIVIRSQDGRQWETVYSKARAPFTSIRKLNGGFVATGQNGVVVSSRDGKHRQEQQIQPVAAFYDVDYFDKSYLLTGDAMALYASKNLKHWTNLSTENLLSSGARSLQHNAEHLLLQTHDYLYNYHNKTWSVTKLPKGDNRLSYISKLSPESESFIATTRDDQVIQSKNGKNWQHLAKLQAADDKATCEGRCTVYNHDLIKLPKGYNFK